MIQAHTPRSQPLSVPGRGRSALPLLLLLAATLTVGACAHVVPPDTHTADTFTVDMAGSPDLALAVWDHRPDVLDGSRDPNWIGLDRTLYGIPIGRQTESGQPFATDLAAMLERSLERSGAEVEVVTVRAGERKERVLDELAATGRSRLVLVRLDEWYNDQFARGTVHHDVTIEVFDEEGESLARASAAGEEDIGRKMRPGRQNASQFNAELMSDLMNQDRLRAALAGEPVPAESTSTEDADDRTCTVEQIVQMRDSGLSEAQIKAACGETV